MRVRRQPQRVRTTSSPSDMMRTLEWTVSRGDADRVKALFDDFFWQPSFLISLVVMQARGKELMTACLSAPATTTPLSKS